MLLLPEQQFYLVSLFIATSTPLQRRPYFFKFEHQVNVLFKDIDLTSDREKRVYHYISDFIRKHCKSEQHIHIILNGVTYSFSNQILRFFREFLLLNSDIEFMKNLWLEKNGAFSGSRVPKIESHIKFTKSIIEMIQSLPNPLDYAEHIKHFEQEIE